MKVQVHTTVARKESPQTASSRPTLNVNRGSRPLSLRTVHVHATDTRARAGHPHALALDPTAAVRVRPTRAHPRAPRTATRRVLGGLEPPSRAPPRPLQHARSTSSTRARRVADGDGAALDHRETAAKSPAALAEEVVGLLRTCEGKGGKQRRSAGRPECGRPHRPHTRGCSSSQKQPMIGLLSAGGHDNCCCLLLQCHLLSTSDLLLLFARLRRRHCFCLCITLRFCLGCCILRLLPLNGCHAGRHCCGCRRGRACCHGSSPWERREERMADD